MLANSLLRVPLKLEHFAEPHKEWLRMLDEAQAIIKEEDAIQQNKTLRLQGRSLPPEVLGRWYASYCNLINKMYDSYLKSAHLQRSSVIPEIIKILVKRMYEIRNELVHIIVNEYIYVDPALAQLRMTPYDIQIVVPYHFATESRSEDLEEALQKMWAEAKRRKRPKVPKPKVQLERSRSVFGETIFTSRQELPSQEDDDAIEYIEEETPPASIQTIPEEYIQAVMIQKHERARQWYMRDFREKCITRRTYFATKHEEPPDELKHKAAKIIERVYREFMKIKRLQMRDLKRDILLGIVPDPCTFGKLVYEEENEKIYQKRRNTRLKIKQTYLKELERDTTRIIMLKKGDIIDDITDQIREWFKEWYYGYGFFPQYPYDVEGGTIMVLRGDYPTVQEQLEEDALMEALNKGKTKEQAKEQRAQAKAEAKMRAEAARLQKKKDALLLFKARCNPFDDPGYKVEESETVGKIVEALAEYRATWSVYDEMDPKLFGQTVYGYLKPLLVEDIMSRLHKECRLYVDELMRLDLKTLIQAHQAMFKRLGLQFPKVKPRKKPRQPPVPKSLVVDQNLLKTFETIFDMDLVTKPTTKLKDIYGDFNFAAYEYNIQDPDATYPPPGYSDVKQRLILSCILACGIQPGAPRNRAVMLLGPPRNGKSFLVDAVAGEINAVKIDITPEKFSAISRKPAKDLVQVFQAARAFQPTVIFMKNIERVFNRKVPPEDKYLQANLLKPVLPKLLKQIPERDKVIFIATCSNPFETNAGPMVSLFDEIIFIPTPDYGSIRQFFHEQLKKETSVPAEFPIQPIAKLCQGYGFGAIIEAYHDTMSPERIITSHVKPLTAGDFLENVLSKGEPLAAEDAQKYLDFFIDHTPLKTERMEYAQINAKRDDAYKKMEKKMKSAAAMK